MSGSFQNINLRPFDENLVKRMRGAKAQVLFQGLHMTHIISMLVYNLKIYILNT
jgi:hypothetical protein